MKKRYLIALFIFVLCSSVSASIKNKGIPFIKNYPRSEYGGGTQNWNIVQNSKGLMYFANNAGVLEFDGNHWNIIPMPNNSIVKSLWCDKNDRIYVGAYSEFGYLEVGEKGGLQYHSMRNLIPKEEKEFEEIWQIFPYKKGVIFHSYKKVFYYRQGKISVLKADNDFHFSYLVNGEFYAQILGKGICKLDGNSFRLIAGGDRLIGQEVINILPYTNNNLLIVTALDGLFVSNPTGVRLLDSAPNAILKKQQVYSALQLDSKNYAFGTVRNGLYIVNELGKIVQHINTDVGLLNNTILSMYKDNQENLWLGLDNGIDYLEVSSPISKFPRDKDIGSGYCSIYHKGFLYLGTNMGLFASPYDFERPAKETQFKLVENTSGQVWSLQVIGGELICGHNNGTFRIEKNRAQLISNIGGGWKYLYKKEYPNVMIGGTYTGLILFDRSPAGKWKFKKRIKGFDESSRELVWNSDNSIWVSHVYKGVYRLNLNSALDSCINVRFYGKKDGLASDLDNSVSEFRREPIFSTTNGIYKYIPEIDRFEKYKSLNHLLFKGEEFEKVKLFELPNGDAWFFQGKEIGYLKLQVDNSYEMIKQPFALINGSFIDVFENVYEVDHNNVIIGTEDGFVHYDQSIQKRYDIPYYTLIREVDVSSHAKDSVLFKGAKNQNTKAGHDFELPYQFNGIKFVYSAPPEHSSMQVKYRYQLQGFDESPSDWEQSISKEYTNLSEGNYVFKVLAMNRYGIQSISDEFKFTILPPWYRSTIAYVVYLIFALILIWASIFIVRFRMKKMHAKLELKQKQELQRKEQKFREEALIAEREIIQLRNDKLRSEVDFKNRELASSTMNIIHKNEVLSYAVGELKKALKKIKDPTALVQVRQLMKTIDSEFNGDHDWEQFELHFDQVHENFLKRLRSAYPALTPKDLRMCAYLRMNLSTKEIAPLMNISVRGVEISRYRLRKKFDLNRDVNLIDFLMNL